jgi:hypothetical protein
MNIKIQEVGGFARRVKALFIKNKAGVVGLDGSLANPFLTSVWIPTIDAVDSIIVTSEDRAQNKGNTKKRNVFMNKLIPILFDLEYKIKKGIKLGTISDSLGSFGLARLRRSITKKSIGKFNLSCTGTIASVNANSNALRDLGFGAVKVASLVTNHVGACGLNADRIVLKGVINTSSRGNNAIKKACMDVTFRVLDAIHVFAEANSNKTLIKMTTRAAVLRSSRKTCKKKERVRIVGAYSSIIFQSRLTGRNVMRLTLLTNERVSVCRQLKKTGVCKVGMNFPYNVLWVGKKGVLEGDGEYIKFTNHSGKKVRVRVFVMR